MGSARYGRYETIRLIASGGMASVYLGRVVGAGGFERLVAIKVMHPHIAHEREFVAMFLDEARLAARIRHPNVVPTLDVAEDGKYIVMEYVEGASLFAISKILQEEEGALVPLPVALRLFLDGLAGLHAAHELTGPDRQPLHIVHRDVSPQNILVGVDGITRITDFGVAHARSRITTTRSGQLKGKLPYMAPEQLRAETMDRRTDVYAAGVMLWELLTGRPLFSANSDAAIACAVLAGPEQSPRELNGAIPAPIDEACMRAIRPLDERYPTAEAFSQALEEAAVDAGVGIAKRRAVGALAKQIADSYEPLSERPAASAGDGEVSSPYASDGDWDPGGPVTAALPPGGGASPVRLAYHAAPEPPAAAPGASSGVPPATHVGSTGIAAVGPATAAAPPPPELAPAARDPALAAAPNNGHPSASPTTSANLVSSVTRRSGSSAGVIAMVLAACAVTGVVVWLVARPSPPVAAEAPTTTAAAGRAPATSTTTRAIPVDASPAASTGSGTTSVAPRPDPGSHRPPVGPSRPSSTGVAPPTTTEVFHPPAP